ncbi:hypothetical protein E3N88_29381 [Mikania micrantha]|uniref:Uncharacterized protein n=1 Tax=Mikania micrantha TaxID=192012 RepID=A0A5N6MJ97_9ASTR|nr:hypothetical protein E3N88_29381 [Mikania micrantha]
MVKLEMASILVAFGATTTTEADGLVEERGKEAEVGGVDQSKTIRVSPNQSENQSGHSNTSQSGQPDTVLQNDDLGSPTGEQHSSMAGPNNPLFNTPLNSNKTWSNLVLNSPSSISSSHYDHTSLRGVWTVYDIYSETIPTQQIEFESFAVA